MPLKAIRQRKEDQFVRGPKDNTFLNFTGI